MRKVIPLFLVMSILILKAAAQELQVDLKEVNDLVSAWTEYHNAKNLPALERLYDDDVIFYGNRLPKVTCIGIKSRRLRSEKKFHEEIITPPSIAVYSSNIIKVAFVKRITSGTRTTDYDAYLLLKPIDHRLKIVGESDLIADGEVGFKLELGEELKQSRLGNAKITREKQPEKLAQRSSIIYIIGGIAIVGLIAWSVKRRRTNSTESNPPKPVVDGRAFEEYIVNRFDVEGSEGWKYFKLLEWRSDKMVNGIYPLSNMYPDLSYQFQSGSFIRQFAIECKYRSRLIKNRFELDPRQLANYKNFETKEGITVYIVLGLGGKPSAPKELFVFPLQELSNQSSIDYSQLRNFYDDPRLKFYYDITKDVLVTKFK